MTTIPNYTALTTAIVNDMAKAQDLPRHIDDEDLQRLHRKAQDLADQAALELMRRERRLKVSP